MARGTRGSGAKNRGKNNLSRKELIKKYGLATFHPDPVEQAKLNATKPSPDFSGDPRYQSTGKPNGNKFIGDSSTSGGTGKKRTETAPRQSNIKMRLGYPLARGPGEGTGDTLLIKCIEYQPPANGMGIGLSMQERGKIVENAGTINGKQYNKGDFYRTGFTNVRLNNTDANSRLSRNSKIKYYVELPIPQEINDSNVVTWGDDSMNIFQLAGVAAASNLLKRPGETFNTALEALQSGIDLGSDIPPELKEAVTNAIAGKAINQLGANVNAGSIISRSTGQVLNSNLELLFGGVNLRTFPFSITFNPRYYEEMLEVKRIIRQFKMAMSAKAGALNGGSANGIFLKSPDVFSLRYLHNGQDHPFLNSFKMCALTGMNVNYTNTGTYASYEDGTPVSVRMNLTFKELNPIYSEDYDGMNDMMGVGY